MPVGAAGAASATAAPPADDARARLASMKLPYEPERGAHPAVVALANERGVICSGTVVHPRLVLTARHCRPARVVLFGHDASRPSDARLVHAFRVPPIPSLDVALVVLDQPTRTAPYALRPASESRPPRGYVRLLGFGATDTRGLVGAGRRRFVDVPISGWGCDGAREAATGCRGEIEMVLPRNGGNDTCSGDSGGPVLEEVGGRLRVVAVTSRSVNGALLTCGDGGIYTRVDRIGTWLASELARVDARKEKQ